MQQNYFLLAKDTKTFKLIDSNLSDVRKRVSQVRPKGCVSSRRGGGGGRDFLMLGIRVCATDQG